jgi:hypothetical protein
MSGSGTFRTWVVTLTMSVLEVPEANARKAQDHHGPGGRLGDVGDGGGADGSGTAQFV